MFSPELIQTDIPEITVIPRTIIFKIKRLLDIRKISYEVIRQDDFPDGCPGGCIYRGKKCMKYVYGIKACVSRESLFKAAEDLFHVNLEEIA